MILRLTLLMGLILVNVQLSAQSFTSKMDVLNDRLKTEKNMDSILKIRNELAVEIKNLISFDSAVVYLEVTVDLALKNKKDLPLGDAYRNLCNIYLNKNDFDTLMSDKN